MTIEDIRTHFDAVQKRYRALRDETGLSYLNVNSDEVFQEITADAADYSFDQQHVPYLFRTVEKSVNPTKVAQRLRQNVQHSSLIHFHSMTRVESVERLKEGRLKLAFSRDNTNGSALYDHIVNAAWFGRLAIDNTLDLVPRRPWLYRFKNGVFITAAKPPNIIPSATFVLGSFGDLVNFQDGSYYASWYPACMVATSREIKPAGWPFSFDAQEKENIKNKTLQNLRTICPAASPLLDSSCDWEMRGNTIFAWGKQGIDRLGSELHQRYDIGVLSDRNYHSVDPGKYTLVPYFANQVVNRIEGLPEEGI